RSSDRAASGPARDEHVARGEDGRARGIARLGLDHDEVEGAARALLLVDVADAAGERKRLAHADRARVLELLLAVHERHEVETELEERLQAARHRLRHE